MMNYKVVARKNPMTKEVKYYAQLVLATPVRLAALAEEISQQCTVTAHDVKAVLSAMEEHILRHLLNGKSVRLGDLGSFRPTLTSEGSDSADKVTVDNVRRVRIRFRGSAALCKGLQKSGSKAEFCRLD